MATNWIVNYNLYMSSNRSGYYFRFPNCPVGIGNIPGNQYWFGWDRNSIFADPRFVDISYGVGANCKLDNFRLQTNSPALRAGANMSQMFTTDKDGKIRPATGPWTIGAYDRPSAPTNLHRILATSDPVQ
jgi:hypothetical protein